MDQNQNVRASRGNVRCSASHGLGDARAGRLRGGTRIRAGVRQLRFPPFPRNRSAALRAESRSPAGNVDPAKTRRFPASVFALEDGKPAPQSRRNPHGRLHLRGNGSRTARCRSNRTGQGRRSSPARRPPPQILPTDGWREAQSCQ